MERDSGGVVQGIEVKNGTNIKINESDGSVVSWIGQTRKFLYLVYRVTVKYRHFKVTVDLDEWVRGKVKVEPVLTLFRGRVRS